MTYVQLRTFHESTIWPDKKPLVSQIDIELTERCNNNCIHCCINLPESDVEARSSEMCTDFVKGVLTQAADLGCLAVRFTGGEPLLRDDLTELYRFTRHLGMQVILFTNARLITSELAELLSKIPPGRVVEVSVYGMSPESYDRVAGHGGAFFEFRRGVDLLLRHKVPFIVKGPKFRFQRGEQEEFEAWAATIPSMDGMPVSSMNFDLRHRRDDPVKNACITRLRATPEETVAAHSRNDRYLKDMAQFCGRFMGPTGERLFTCGAGHGTCVDAYGRAQLCLSLRTAETVVDLHKATLKQALEDSFPAIRKIRAVNPDYLRRCARCFLKGLCQQCPAKSWLEHGSLDTPVEYLCQVAHAEARYLGLLDERELAWEVEDWQARVAGFLNTRGATLQPET